MQGRLDDVKAEVVEVNRELSELNSRFLTGELSGVGYRNAADKLEERLCELHCELDFIEKIQSHKNLPHYQQVRFHLSELRSGLRSHSRIAVIIVSVLLFLLVYVLVGSQYARTRTLEYRRAAYMAGVLADGPTVEPVAHSSFGYRFRDWEIPMVRVAEYEATVMVASKNYRRYLRDVSPVDLLFAWGEYANPENDRYIGFVQFSTLGTVVVAGGAPLSLRNPPGGVRPWCNVHVYPASEGVYDGIRAIRTNEVVSLEGFLVNVIDGGQVVKTRLEPGDRSGGGQEYLYLTKVTVSGRIYE